MAVSDEGYSRLSVSDEGYSRLSVSDEGYSRLSVSDEGYSRLSVSGEGYSRNTSCTVDEMSMFLLLAMAGYHWIVKRPCESSAQ
jgi:hypothetical protein